MLPTPITVCLPIADRPASLAFYRDGLGLEPFGPPADDGVPEPLQFIVNDGLRIMLIPTGGFAWVIGDHTPAPKGTSECILGVTADEPAAVDAIVNRAREAGAAVISAPGPQPWGYVGAFADPDGHLWTVTALP